MAKRVIKIVIVLAALAVLAGFAYLKLDAFNGARQSYAASLLNEALDLPASINGSVNISLGAIVVVEINDVQIGGKGETPSGHGGEIKRLELGVPISGIFTGRISIEHITLAGVDFEFSDSMARTTSDPPDWVFYPARFIKYPISIDAEDISFRFLFPESGWDESVRIDKLSSRLHGAGTKIQADVSGKVNDVPLSLQGSIANIPANNAYPPANFSIVLSVSGTNSNIDGTIDVFQPIPVINASFQSKSSALGNLLEMFHLNRSFEGTGESAASLVGALNDLRVDHLSASALSETGYEIATTGSIADLNKLAGFKLAFSGKIPQPPVDQQNAPAFLDLAVTGFSGTLTGDLNEMSVDSLTVFTDSLSAELRDIGPISIDRITKDQEGRLGIHGIRIWDGPPERRTVELTGDIDDALVLEGIRLAGKFDLPTSDAFSLEGPGVERLGRLIGKISVSDQDGALDVNEFKAGIAESDLLNFDVSLAGAGDKPVKSGETAINVDIKIPDFAGFAAALGEKTKAAGGLEYTGVISASENQMSLSGKVAIDQSQLEGKLTAAVVDGSPAIKGAIQSQSLAMTDIRELWEANLIPVHQDFDDVSFSEEFSSNLKVDVDIDVKEFAEAGKGVGNFKGHIAYANETLVFEPFSLNYLDGTISTSTKVRLGESPNHVSSSGTIKKLRLESLLPDLGFPKIATGSLSTKFEIEGRGDDAISFVKSVSGNIRTSVWGGSIGTGLLNLTGMNYITWLVNNPKNNTSKIVCAVAPISLKNGRVTANNLVIETEHVQVVGSGTINFHANSINLAFRPYAKVARASTVATPFFVTGKLSNPDISVKNGNTVGRVASELFMAPFDAFANIFAGKLKPDEIKKQRPCVVPRKRLTKRH